jgi:hypothetical protein
MPPDSEVASHSWLPQNWPWDGLQNGARAEVTSPEAPYGVTSSNHFNAFGSPRSHIECDIVWVTSMLNSLQGPRASRPASPAVSIAASQITGNKHNLGCSKMLALSQLAV